MNKYSLLFFCLSLILLSSCKKDIEINYHQVDPIYVVEASVSNEGMEARISQTNDMDDNSTTSDINHASVVVTGSDGSRHILSNTENGIYRSHATGTPGVEYTIDIQFDGNHFTSSSIMQKTPKMNKFRFLRKKIVAETYLMGELLLQDIPNEENWYFIHIYRNKTGYRWSVLKDDTNPNKELQQLFGLFQEGSNDEDVLHEGEVLHIVVRAIDQRAYDYLYSMEQMDETGTNPINNFAGGCLGYFSAHSEFSFERVYHKDEVEDEE